MKSIYILLLAPIVACSCKKFVEIDPPANTIVSEQAFSNDNNANTSINGLYAKLINQSTSFSFGNSAASILFGLASDETNLFLNDQELFQIYHNQILSNNGNILSPLWQQPYEIIYRANACLEQLQNNGNVTPSLKEQLIGESKFIRAYCYFYLINTFGDVPFLTSTNYLENEAATRTSKDLIYTTIINDLESSISSLPDYSKYNNEKIRCTKWAAMAFLARLYLFTGNWEKADYYASQIISSTNFNLPSNLNDVFLKNSDEAIFQLYIDGTISPYNVIQEGRLTIPRSRTNAPNFYLPNSFVNQFDSTDKRRKAWIDSTKYLGTVYYIPYKYKNGPAQSIPNSSPTQYYMVFRLAEQYLIRAEAKAQKQDLTGSAADVNVIRARSGLNPLSFSSTDDAINKILEERKKELFYEWGHRWFDLKRTGKIDAIMSNVSAQKGGAWQPSDKLFPIPFNEIFRDSHLTQNTGY